MYINYCYFRLLAVRLFGRELAGFQDVDVNIINPLVSMLLSPRNIFVPFLLKAWVVIFNQYDHHSVPNRMLKFIYTIPRGTTVMDHALYTLCYVDDFALLQAEYNAFINALWGSPENSRRQGRSLNRSAATNRHRTPSRTREMVPPVPVVEKFSTLQSNNKSQQFVNENQVQDSRNNRSVSFDEAILTTPISDIINSDKEDVVEPDEIPLSLSQVMVSQDKVNGTLKPSKTFAGVSERETEDITIGRSNTWSGDKAKLQRRLVSDENTSLKDQLTVPKSPIPSRSVSPSVNIIPLSLKEQPHTILRGRSPQPHRHFLDIGSEVKHAVSGVFPRPSNLKHRRSNLLQPPIQRSTEHLVLPERGVLSPAVQNAAIISFADGRSRHLLDSSSGIPSLLQTFRSNIAQAKSPVPQYRVNPSSLDKFFLKSPPVNGSVNSTNLARSTAMEGSYSNPISGSALIDDSSGYAESDSELPYPTQEYLR